MNLLIQCFLYESTVLTRGNPRPALAQLTPASFSFRTSATGLIKLEGGNNGLLQEGQVYPLGAVVGGNCLEKWSKQDQ